MQKHFELLVRSRFISSKALYPRGDTHLRALQSRLLHRCGAMKLTESFSKNPAKAAAVQARISAISIGRTSK